MLQAPMEGPPPCACAPPGQPRHASVQEGSSSQYRPPPPTPSCHNTHHTQRPAAHHTVPLPSIMPQCVSVQRGGGAGGRQPTPKTGRAPDNHPAAWQLRRCLLSLRASTGGRPSWRAGVCGIAATHVAILQFWNSCKGFRWGTTTNGTILLLLPCRAHDPATATASACAAERRRCRRAPGPRKPAQATRPWRRRWPRQLPLLPLPSAWPVLPALGGGRAGGTTAQTRHTRGWGEPAPQHSATAMHQGRRCIGSMRHGRATVP